MAQPLGKDILETPLRKITDSSQDQPPEAVRYVSFSEAFRFWLKLGFISFGGPAGQIAIMHKELVEKRRWISEERFLHSLNYCMLLPGPEAQQLAIYIGWLMHRTLGGVVAGTLFIVPSIFVLLALSYVYAAYGNMPLVTGILSGFKPAVVAIVVEALIKIGGRALKGRDHFAIAALSFVGIYLFHLPFPLILIAAGTVGLIDVHYFPKTLVASSEKDKKTETEQNGSGPAYVPTVIDDNSSPPLRAIPSPGRMLRILAVGIGLWVLPFTLLVSFSGWESLPAQEYRFFTQAALVTFGGAYAVLAYVTQAAVGSFRWITPGQAVDGLALAETTPGPLIMVLQFVGFMAGWNNPGLMSPAINGVICALATTYATFLPCFIFIFLGAPYIEVLRGNQSLSGALSGVTAAVVGVILNLALVFGATVILPEGFSGRIDLFAGAISVASFIALRRFKANVIWMVLAAGLIGFLRIMFSQ